MELPDLVILDEKKIRIHYEHEEKKAQYKVQLLRYSLSGLGMLFLTIVLLYIILMEPPSREWATPLISLLLGYWARGLVDKHPFKSSRLP